MERVGDEQPISAYTVLVKVNSIQTRLKVIYCASQPYRLNHFLLQSAWL